MTEQEAKALAERIKQQFPFHDVTAAQSADKRYWFVGVQRMDGGHVLILRSAYEWDEALHIVEILKDEAKSGAPGRLIPRKVGSEKHRK